MKSFNPIAGTIFVLCAIYTVMFFIFIIRHPDAFKCSDKVICTQ